MQKRRFEPIAMKEMKVAMQNKTKPDIRMSDNPFALLHAISVGIATHLVVQN